MLTSTGLTSYTLALLGPAAVDPRTWQRKLMRCVMCSMTVRICVYMSPVNSAQYRERIPRCVELCKALQNAMWIGTIPDDYRGQFGRPHVNVEIVLHTLLRLLAVGSIVVHLPLLCNYGWRRAHRERSR